MIYLISFFRRLTAKSSFYFSLPIALLVFLFTCDVMISLLSLFAGAVVMNFVGFLINESDKKKKTGVKCRLCLHDHCVPYYPAKKKKQKEDFGSFACSSFDHGKHSEIYYCPQCRNGFLIEVGTAEFEETKSKGHELYENVVDEEYIKNIEARYLTSRGIIDAYPDYFKGQKVLEVGCYYGAFLDEVIKDCESYVGIEPSKHACGYNQEKHPEARIINGNIDSVEASGALEGELFDTICMWDVIEHVPDPVGMIRKLHKYLKPGGYLLFSTINIESTLAIAMGPFWPWYMDMHYFYFSDRGYVDMLHRSGYGLKLHAHYPYIVKAHYFIRKVFSLIGINIGLSSFLKNSFGFNVPIKMGDVVLIAGRKESEDFH